MSVSCSGTFLIIKIIATDEGKNHLVAGVECLNKFVVSPNY